LRLARTRGRRLPDRDGLRLVLQWTDLGFGVGDEVPAGGVDGFGAQEQDLVVDAELAQSRSCCTGSGHRLGR
jgi:hypothetical protein